MNKLLIPLVLIALVFFNSCGGSVSAENVPVNTGITQEEVNVVASNLEDNFAPAQFTFNFVKNGLVVVPFDKADSILRVFFPTINQANSCQANHQSNLDIKEGEVLHISVAVLDLKNNRDMITVTKYADSKSIPANYSSEDISNFQFTGGVNLLQYKHDGEGEVDPVIHGEGDVRDPKIIKALGVNLRYEDMYLQLMPQVANPNQLKIVAFIDSSLTIDSNKCVVQVKKGFLYEFVDCTINSPSGNFFSTCHLK